MRYLILVPMLLLAACTTTSEPQPDPRDHVVARQDGTTFHTLVNLTGQPGDDWTCTYFTHVEGHSVQLNQDIVLEAFQCEAPCPEDAPQMALLSDAALIRHWLDACGPLPTKPTGIA
jgi:hypothetical protein